MYNARLIDTVVIGSHCLVQFNTLDDKGLGWLIRQTQYNKTCFVIFVGEIMGTIVCVHPDTIKKVLKLTEVKQIDGLYDLFRPWLGKQGIELELHRCFTALVGHGRYRITAWPV